MRRAKVRPRLDNYGAYYQLTVYAEPLHDRAARRFGQGTENGVESSIIVKHGLKYRMVHAIVKPLL